MLPGVKLNTGPTDFAPISQLQMQRFKGEKCEPFGDIISGDCPRIEGLIGRKAESAALLSSLRAKRSNPGASKEDWIASSFALRASADAVVARVPRNDGAGDVDVALGTAGQDQRMSSLRRRRRGLLVAGTGRKVFNPAGS
jgi:hypothetical protein